jgi:hypothetical protein
LLDLCAELGRAPHVSLDHELGRDVAGRRAEGGREHVLDRELRHELARLRRREQARVDPVALLELDRLLEARHVGCFGEQKQVAPQAQVERRPDFLLEALQAADRLEPDPDVQLVGEERPHAARAVPGRTGSKRLPLEQQRPLAAAPGEVVARGRADDPATHHDRVAPLLLHHERGYPATRTLPQRNRVFR